MGSAEKLFTTFICWHKLFQWLHVPMGLKGAPSFVQRVMATAALVGSLWTLKVELYVVGSLVFRSTFEEYY